MMNNLMKRILLFILFPLTTLAQLKPEHNLQFNHLAKKWDEAMPLGNGMLGALIWEKDNKLRLSLDRADLWDERKAMDISKFNFKWVEEQVLKKDYAPVQKIGDAPYANIPYPTKLPAAAMEFNIADFGAVVSNVLDIKTAVNTVKFSNGVIFTCYIDATDQKGSFSFENLPHRQTSAKSDTGIPNLIVHDYNKGTNSPKPASQELEALGYKKGTVTKQSNSILYKQPTYDGRYYEVLIEWKKFSGNKIMGNWKVSNNKPASVTPLTTVERENAALTKHLNWWKNFWAKSAVSLPDPLLEKQYYLELYKLGSVARAGAPAITLQSVWTADNGSMPPWKGDFHNDLNTQLSYWPTYTGNHLAEAATYTDWLWKIKPGNLKYTRQYFGVDGLNVPGVATFSGAPMGGWIQYALSPTVSAWCAQHFYWQWKYSMDKRFLAEKAYPYIYSVATYLKNITRLKDGVRKLPLSSSPEYNDNNLNAWFLEWSNFDLSLCKFLFSAATELSKEMNKPQEAHEWQEVLKQLPDYEINETGFTVAPGQNLNESHRHMSQYMSIYPLALLDINNASDKTIIENSLKRIEEKGTSAWCGYSFSWMASLYARAYKADQAVKQLQIFTTNFCSPNSFHLNGDQKGGEHSGYIYSPFTLEGNFAFAQGVHELLLQSRKDYIEVFPAVPSSWKNVSFKDLRGEGAFLVSAAKKNGTATSVKVLAEKGGILKIKLPVEKWRIRNRPSTATKTNNAGIITLNMKKGETVLFESQAL